VTVMASPPTEVEPRSIRRNPNNPRRYFNDESLDLLRTSIQEVGILVPLIVYRDSRHEDQYVLMDGERRWRSALDLGVPKVPVNVIPAPSPLENLLRMFNIHSVRDEWPLISIALSLQEVIRLSGEEREGRLAEMTGLTRSTVRRARRLLSLPKRELDLIQREAHLERSAQVHREDLYLEIEAAVSVVRDAFPEIAKVYSWEKMVREFVRKREEDHLTAVTDFRYVNRLVKAAQGETIPREVAHTGLVELIVRPDRTPRDVFDEIGARAYEQQTAARKAELLADDLEDLDTTELAPLLVTQLTRLRDAINSILAQR
jgi:ParB family chromosome partitioning protein